MSLYQEHVLEKSGIWQDTIAIAHGGKGRGIILKIKLFKFVCGNKINQKKGV